MSRPLPHSALVISLRPSTSSMLRFGLAVRGAVALVSLVTFGVSGIWALKAESWFAAALSLGIAAFLFFVVKKYFENVYYREELLLIDETLTVVHKTWSNETRHTFRLDEILYLGYAGYQNYTDHAMSSPVMDITGLAATEKEMQFLIDEGTIEIETADKVLRFGKNLGSWDAEEALDKVKEHTGIVFKKKYRVEDEEKEEEA